MTVPTHVVLIRGINVGGNNAVPMAGLRTALEARGYDAVRTYIQSGNVLLAAPGQSDAQITAHVEDLLRAEFGVDTVVVTITADTLRAAVADAPHGFGADTDTFKHDVVFLRPSRPAADVFPLIETRDGVDECWQGEGVLYFRRLSAKITGSYMRKVIAMPAYKDMTIRNWRTTTTLARMLDEA